MKNPNTPIRDAVIKALRGIEIACWAKLVPKAVKPVPKIYALISSQTKERTAIDKDGFEWDCSIVIDLNSVSEAGYADPSILDDLEELVLNVMNDDLEVDNFIVKEMSLFDSRDIDSLTNTLTLSRRVLTYTMWLNNID